MILRELKNEVISLGFDDIIEREDLFITSANRALRDIYTERVITKTVSLFANGDCPAKRIKEIRHVGGTDLTLPLVGRAYSMQVFGEGVIIIRDGADTKTLEFSSESDLIRGFINSGGDITFSGELSYTVRHLAFFEEIFSRRTEDIPAGDTVRIYDIRKTFGDFMSFASLPKDNTGKCIPNCTLSDGKLKIDSSYRGEIVLTYRRLPKKIVSDFPDEEIDIPNEFSHLLPLLTASYVWLDDDEQMAKYYREMYLSMLANCKVSSYEKIDTQYINTNGWA